MPFKSEAQRRYLWANEPEIARDWTDTYGSRIQKSNGGITNIKKIKGQPHMLAYITPGEANILKNLGGQEIMTSEGIPSYYNPNEDRAREERSARDQYNAAANQQRSQTFDAGRNQPDPGFQNALRDQQRRQDTITASQNPNYGQFFNTRVPVHTPPTLGQRIGQGIGNFASGVGNYLTSGGIWGAVAQGLGKFRDWNNAMQRSRFQKQYERKNPHPMGFVWDDWTEKDWAEKKIDEIPGYREYLTGLTPQQTGEGGGIPLWQQLGYPSYEAWAAAQNQGIAGIELDDDVITSDDIALRFIGADRTLNPQAVGLENTDQLREMIQERVKNLYT